MSLCTFADTLFSQCAVSNETKRKGLFPKKECNGCAGPAVI